MPAVRRKGVVDALPQRLNVRISTAAHQRLVVHALMSGTTPGRLVEALISEHLREWAVRSNRASRAVPDDRLEASDPVSLEGSEAA